MPSYFSSYVKTMMKCEIFSEKKKYQFLIPAKSIPMTDIIQMNECLQEIKMGNFV
jgi:hypothetical protein